MILVSLDDGTICRYDVVDAETLAAWGKMDSN